MLWGKIDLLACRFLKKLLVGPNFKQEKLFCGEMSILGSSKLGHFENRFEFDVICSGVVQVFPQIQVKVSHMLHV